MAAIAGRLGELWAAFDATPPAGSVAAAPGDDPSVEVPAGLASGAVVDITMNGNVDELETTVHNSAGATPAHSTARTYIPNFHDETLDMTLRYNEADVTSMNILVCAMNSYLFNFWYRPDGPAFDAATPGANQFYGQAFSTSFSPGSPLDDTGSFDVTLRLSGVTLDTLP